MRSRYWNIDYFNTGWLFAISHISRNPMWNVFFCLYMPHIYGPAPPSSNNAYLGQTVSPINQIVILSGSIHDVYRLCIDDHGENNRFHWIFFSHRIGTLKIYCITGFSSIEKMWLLYVKTIGIEYAISVKCMTVVLYFQLFNMSFGICNLYIVPFVFFNLHTRRDEPSSQWPCQCYTIILIPISITVQSF